MPVPNNGTLRLPLKPIGLHNDSASNGLETPSDPVETHTISTSPAPHTQATKPVLVDPVPTSSAAPVAPTNTVAVDQPAPPQHSQPPQSSRPPSDSTDDSDNDGGSDSDSDEDDVADKVESSVKDFWNWFTGKVGNWWGKVTGHGKGDGESSDEGSASG